jgi:hypothetical protein
MVITVVKSDDGSVSASVDSPATTIGAANDMGSRQNVMRVPPLLNAHNSEETA